MEKIRWGILGTGRIAGDFARGLTAVDDAELVAVGSRTAESANAFADKFSVPTRHASYEALANDSNVDIVYVATPHSLHKENTILCLEGGRAVLCEKPFAINTGEAEEMIAASKRTGRFLMEAMWTHCLPHMQEVARLIADGAIGDIQVIQADFCFRSKVNPASRLYRPELGGGALLDVGVYPVALAYRFLGQPDAVRSWAHLGVTGVDENAGMVFGYNSGALAVMTTSVRANTHHTARISGSAGEIIINEHWWGPSSFTLRRDGHAAQEIHPESVGNGWNYEAVEAGRCLRAGLTESPIVPHADTLAVMRLLDGLRAEWGLRYPME